MNLELAAMYGTPGAPSQEDLEKTAQAELFAKLAADNGLDLNQLTDPQIAQLWDETFGTKTAGEIPPQFKKKDEDKDEDKEKKEKAEKEHEEKKAALAKFAEADHLGRVMAHAYVSELTKIGQALEGKPASADPSEKLKAAMAKLKKTAEPDPDPDPDPDKKKGKEKKAEPDPDPDPDKKPKMAPPGAKKEASAIDQLAAEKAVKLAADNKFDPEEAAGRINAVFALGMLDENSVKVASAPNVEAATDIRALELLEAAGYPVTWGKE